MNAQRLAVGLMIVNLLLLAGLFTRAFPATAVAAVSDGSQAAAPAIDQAVPILRGRALELVDERGQVRSRLSIEPGGDVVLRLFDSTGTIRVKLGAGQSGSGLLLLDETTEPAVQLIARAAATTERPTTTRLTLWGANGRQRIIEP